MINENDLVEVNKLFDKGVIVNRNSLKFALSSVQTTKDWIKQLAYIVRAMLIDHVFEEGNKRTSAVVIAHFFEYHNVAYDPYRVDKIIAEIIIDSISNIEQIRRKLKDAIR